MRPITVEVVSNVFTTFSICNNCELFFQESGVNEEANKEILEEYPAEFKEDLLKLSEWIRELKRLYKHRIHIVLIDVKSPVGVYKSLIHRFRTYPAFIVEKKDVITGWDPEKLYELIDTHIKRGIDKKLRKYETE
jgi:hypothetical protein